MLRVLFISVIISLLFFPPQVAAQDEAELKLEEEIELTNDIASVYQYDLTRFSLYQDVLFFISADPVSLSSYSLKNGEQLFFNDLEGSGPYEMGNLINITIDEDEEKIYLLDFTGKVIGFNFDGEPVHESAPKLPRSKNFIVVDDSFWIVNESPAEKTHLTQQAMNSGKQNSIGPEQPFENILFSAFKRSGSIHKEEDRVLLIMPFGRTLYHLSFGGKIVETTELNIPDFQSTEGTKEREVYFNNPKETKKFFEENSTITKMVPIQDGYALEVLHMHDNYRRDLVLFNNEFELRCSTTLTGEDQEIADPRIRFSDGENVYFYREEIDEDENVNRILSRYRLECAE